MAIFGSNFFAFDVDKKEKEDYNKMTNSQLIKLINDNEININDLDYIKKLEVMSYAYKIAQNN